MASAEQVQEFLNHLHGKMNVYQVFFRTRDKNKKGLEELEILPIEREKIIKSLTIDNYHSGPNEDTYDSSKPNYYEFGYISGGDEIYIKISAGKENKPIDCMSFHIAERPLTYPLRRTNK